MAPTAQELMADAQKALRLGNPQLADDLLSAGLATPQTVATAGAAPAAAAPTSSTPPRNPQAIVTDLFSHLVSRAGNPPALEALLRELDQAFSPPPTE